MKKITLVLFTLLALLPLGAWAEEKTIDNVTYTYSGTTATVKSVANATTISIPDKIEISGSNYNVTSIASDAFKNCTSLLTLKFASSELPTSMAVDFAQIDQGLYIIFGGIQYTHKEGWNTDKDYFLVTKFDTETGIDENIKIHATINNIPVTEIANDAFLNVSKGLTIGKNITSIGATAFANTSYPNKLTSISVENGNTKYSAHGGALYTYTGETLELVTCPESKSASISWAPNITSIGDNAFITQKNLTSISIPSTVKSIGRSAFQYAGSTAGNFSITFNTSSQLESIGPSAFQQSALTTITPPDGLTTIGENAFINCDKIEEVKLLSSSLTDIGANAFSGCKLLETIHFASNYNGLKIGNKAFYNCKLSNTIEIPNGVITIGDNAFNWDDDFYRDNNPNLKQFRVPSTVTTYGNNVVYRTVTIQRKLGLDFSTGNYLTYYSTIDVTLPTEKLKAYQITGVNDDNTLITEEINYIPKEHGVLLVLDENATLDKETWYDPYSGTSADFENNKLVGSTNGISDINAYVKEKDDNGKDVVVLGEKYVLSGENFVKVNQGNLPPFRCFLFFKHEDQEKNPSNYLYFKNQDDVEDGHTYIYKENGEFIKYNASIGSASLTTEGSLMKLTVTPGSSYYAYMNDITVRKNTKAAHGRASAISIDETKYDLNIVGENTDPDPNGTIEYTFDPKGASVFEVTVNFHKRTNLSDNVTREATLDIPTEGYTYDGSVKKPEVTSFTFNNTEIDEKNYKVSYEENANAGSHNVTLTGIRECMGTYSTSFSIAKRDINKITVDAIADQTFTGSAITPALTNIKDVITGESIITTNDYSITYEYNTKVTTDAQKAKANIVAKETNYAGTKVVEFIILPKEMTDADVPDINAQTWTGSAVEPKPTIKYGDITLEEGTDYTVTYENNINSGNDAKAIFTFKGNYKGTVTKTFGIKDHNESINVQFENPDNQWTTYYGKDNLKLADGLKAYVVTGVSGTTVETKEVSFIPKNTPVLLYSESGKKEFNLETYYSATLTGVTPHESFKGTDADVDISTISGNKFVLYKDEFIQAKEGYVKAHRCYLLAEGNIEGVIMLKTSADSETQIEGITIETKMTENGGEPNIASALGSISVSANEEKDCLILTVSPNPGFYAMESDIQVVRYLNANNSRAPEVGDNKMGIVADADNKHAGATCKYSIPFLKDYNYQFVVDFKKCINLQEQGKQPTINMEDASYTYDGNEKKPQVESVTIPGQTEPLKENVDYIVSYKNNVNAGTAQVVVEGINRYYNDFPKEFKIGKRSLNSDKVIVKLDKESYVYTGKPIEPTFTVIEENEVNGKVVNIVRTEDFEITYTDNVNVSTSERKAMISLHGILNYDDYKNAYFVIEPKKLDSKNVEPIADTYYTGEPITPTPVIKDGDYELTADDYDVAYTDNLYEGTAKVNITFKGNYKGTAETEFKIQYKELSRTVDIAFEDRCQWTTFYWHENLNVKDQDLTVFVVTGHKSGTTELITREVNFIPANTGVLLRRNSMRDAYTGKTLPISTALPEGVQPDKTLFVGTKDGIDDLSKINGAKFILVSDDFVQTTGGSLAAHRCYAFYGNGYGIDGITTFDAEKELNGIYLEEEGQKSNADVVGKVTMTPSGNKATLTVEPKYGYYAEAKNITIIRTAKGTSARAASIPSVENSVTKFTSTSANPNPSKKATYTFDYDADCQYQITVNFKKCTDLSKGVDIDLSTTSFEYDGLEKKPSVENVRYGGVKLRSEYYKVSYENNIDAGGYARVIVEGDWFYSGKNGVNFNITQRDISKASIEANIPDQEYTGNPIEIDPKFIVVSDSIVIGTKTVDDKEVDVKKNIISAEDYTLVYTNNVEVGKAKVTVMPTSRNYNGHGREFFFNIVPSTGINQISVDEQEGQWFDLNGQRIEGHPTQKGVYILRRKNQEAIKVRIK